MKKILLLIAMTFLISACEQSPVKLTSEQIKTCKDLDGLIFIQDWKGYVTTVYSDCKSGLPPFGGKILPEEGKPLPTPSG